MTAVTDPAPKTGPAPLSAEARLEALRRLYLQRDKALKSAGVLFETGWDKQIKSLLGLGRREKGSFGLAEFDFLTRDQAGNRGSR